VGRRPTVVEVGGTPALARKSVSATSTLSCGGVARQGHAYFVYVSEKNGSLLTADREERCS